MKKPLPPKPRITEALLKDLIAQFSPAFDVRAALLYASVRDTGRRLTAIADGWLAEYGVSERMLTVLLALYVMRDSGPIQFDELSEREKLPPATLSAILDVLTERRYVTRKPLRTDARRKVIALTAAGRSFLHALFVFRGRQAERLFEFLDPNDRDELITLLDRLGHAFDLWEAAELGTADEKSSGSKRA
jgi:DNA-binding MarR family transcriptional regulator